MSSALLTEPWLWPLAVALGVYMVALVGVGVLVLYGLVAKIGDVRDDAQAEAFAGVSAGPARRVVALLVEAACQLFALGLQAGHALGLLPKYQGTGDGVPVVVLPGYTENAGTMWWLCRRLASAGFNVHGVSFPSTYSKLETNMKFLRERLAEIRTAHGGQPVAVVAHSMGGVITRAHTLDHEDHGVLTLVAFASPFRGANVARLGALLRLGKSVVQLRPGSAFMCRYSPDRELPVPTLSLIAFQEDIVTPEWSVVAAGVETRVLPEPWGHAAPLFLAGPFELARGWLLAHGVRRNSGATSR